MCHKSWEQTSNARSSIYLKTERQPSSLVGSCSCVEQKVCWRSDLEWLCLGVQRNLFWVLCFRRTGSVCVIWFAVLVCCFPTGPVYRQVLDLSQISSPGYNDCHYRDDARSNGPKKTGALSLVSEEPKCHCLSFKLAKNNAVRNQDLIVETLEKGLICFSQDVHLCQAQYKSKTGKPISKVFQFRATRRYKSG